MFETPIGNLIIPLIFISFFLIILSLVIFLRTNYFFKYPTPLQFFFIFFVIYNVLGWPFVLKGMSHLGQINYDESFYIVFFFYIHLCLLSMALGALWANLLTGARKSDIARFYLKPLAEKKYSIYRPFFIASLLILGWFSLKNLNKIFTLFTPEYYILRQEIAQEGNYSAYIMSKALVPFLGTYAIGYIHIYFRRFKYLITFLIIFLTLLGSLSTFQKSPFVLSLLTIGLFLLLLYRKPLKLKDYFLLILFALLIPIFISWFSSGGIDIKTLIMAYFDRLILIGNFLDYEAMYLAHNVGSLFLGGTSFPLLFRGTELNNDLGSRLWIELFPDMYNAGKIGTANTCFITALYWDFGFIGGIIGSFFFGFFLQLVQILLLRSSKDIFVLSTFATLSLFALKFNYTHLGTALLSEGFGVILLIFLTFIFLKELIKFNRWKYNVWNIRNSI